jgi:tol-pal system protein YbgF
MHRTLRIVPATLALAAVLFTAPSPAFAANKDMVELQTQVRALQDAIARLQQSNDERMGVMKDLIQQTTDAVNKMGQTMDGVQRQMRAQSEGTGKNVEQLSGQMQSLNDSLDELKARLGRIEKNIGDVQSQQQSISAKVDSGGGVAGGGAPATDTPPSGNAPAPIVRNGKPSAAIPAAPALPTTPAAPPVEDLYRTAFSDFNGAKYTLASAEFNDVIKYYPDSNLAGNAYFYLGEIDYKAGRFSAAAKNYDKVAEQYPGNPKTAISQLRKGESLLAQKQTDAGVRELRSLIQRYPNTQEATAARSKLNALGVTVVPRTR